MLVLFFLATDDHTRAPAMKNFSLLFAAVFFICIHRKGIEGNKSKTYHTYAENLLTGSNPTARAVCLVGSLA